MFNGVIINPFIICAIQEQEVYRAYADREKWELQCTALGATLEQARAYEADAVRYAQTTLYSTSDVVAWARWLAYEALLCGKPMPASAEQAIKDEQERAMARLIGGKA